VPVCERPFARGEWAADTVVVLTLSRAPAIGETATASVEMCARRAGSMHVGIVLPDAFDWLQVPSRMSLTSRPSSDPANFGCLDIGSGVWPVSARQPLVVTATVVARKAGFAALTATARLAEPGTPGTGNSAGVFLTVGRSGSSSYFGYRPDSARGDAVPVPKTQPAPSCPPPSG
jgi:hypothetical protein